MGSRLDLTGHIYGRLTVIKKSHVDKKQKQHWECICECGNITHPMTSHLRNGSTRSCGCLSKELAYNRAKEGILMKNNKQYKKGTRASHLVHKSYKTCAKRRDYEFELQYNDFMKLVTENCYYCGSSLGNTAKDPRNTLDIFHYTGIDRVDNDRGYVLDNLVPCCKTCNISKRAQSKDGFINWVTKCYKNLEMKGLIDE